MKHIHYIRFLFATLILLGAGTLALAQSVSGTVYDVDGFPLTGATIQQLGSTSGTVTDLDGKFTLSTTGEEPVLRISYLGYVSQDVPVNGRDNLTIELSGDSKLLDEVVVIGYGTQTRDNVSGALSTLSTESIEGRPVASFQQAIQGQVAGLNITSNSGAPGGASTVRIRGTSSITGGSNPLYVVDGLIIQSGSGIAGDPFATINPNDIASVTVLKDASAAAIYGARGANGVIIITTKRGSIGKPKISFNTYVGTQSVTNTLDLLNADQYREVRTTVAEASGETVAPNWMTDNGVDTDWQNALFQSGSIQNYELSASGGSENLNYYTSLGYYDEEGTIVGTGLDRFTLRVNTDTRLGRFKFGNNLTVSRSRIEQDYDGLGRSILAWTLLSPPTVPIRNEDNLGGFQGATNADGDPRILNPIAAQELVERGGVSNRILGNLYAELELIDGLNFRGNFGVDQANFRNRTYAPFFDLGTGEAVVTLEDGAEVSERYGQSLNVLLEGTVNFKRELAGGHSLDLLAGVSGQEEARDAVNLRSVGQNISPGLPVVGGSTIFPTPPSGFQEELRTVSTFGRVMYDFNDRYLATFNFRRDGSSIFTEDNYFRSFLSGSVGWVISNEAFLKDNEVISNLKLRASYGSLGNDQINAAATLSLLNNQARYIFGAGQTIAASLAPGGLVANPNLVWEKQTQLNLGVDLGFLQDKATLSVDYFQKNSDDLLLSFPLPSATGFNNIFLNAGEVQNTGVEVALGYNNQIGKLSYSFNGNVSFLNNEVIGLTEGLETIDRNATNEFTARNRIQPGQSLFAFYGYQTDGIYQNEQEIENGPTPLGGTAAPGDFRFRDVDGDGAITEDDRTFIGDANPDLQFGFGMRFDYGGLDFSFQFQGVSGNQIWNDTKYLTESYFRISNLSTNVLDAWTPENGSNTQPRQVSPNQSNNDVGSDFFVEDGAYLRLKNLQLGYSLSDNLMNTVDFLQRARIYIAAQNLLTFTQYSGYDPEVGGSGGFGFDNVGYPQSRRITFGLSLGF